MEDNIKKNAELITLEDIKKHPQVLECVAESDRALGALGYTDHGLRHLNLTADRAKYIAKAIGLSEREIELAAIAGFCHDFGNFMGRTEHHYWSALLFHQIFQNDFSAKELIQIIQAIANHDKADEMKFSNNISAVLVLADKSDVHRSRVRHEDINIIKQDIYDRVNYAVTSSKIKVRPKSKQINLTLSIDAKFVPIMEYFEIFVERMGYCRKAADYLGFHFGLFINNFKLL